MSTIYSKGIKGYEGEAEVGSERSRTDYADAFVAALSEEMTKMLDVKWRDKSLIERLIKTGIEEFLCGRSGLLEQYFHSQLDIVVRTFKRRLDINESVEVDYKNAVHAKLNSIIKEIEKQMGEAKLPEIQKQEIKR